MGFVRWLLLPPPVADPVLARRASLLRTLLAVVIISAFVAGASSFLVPDPIANLTWNAGFLVLELLCLVALRRGYVQLATWVSVLGLWAGLTAVCAVYDGMVGPVPITFTVVVLLAALVLPWRGSMTITVLCELTIFGLTAFDLWMGRDPYERVFGAVATIPSIGALATTAVYALDTALERAQRREIESREALERVARSHSYRLGVLNALGEPVLVADGAGAVQYANPSALALLRLTSEEVLALPLARLVVVDGEPLVPEVILRTGSVLGVEGCLVTGPGLLVPVQLSVTAVTGESGEPAVVCCATDLTLRKNATAELERALRLAVEASTAKSRFLANMSHELRTPLNAIIGYAEILLEEPDLDSVPEDLGRIRDSGRHLLSLINDVLDLSKIEAGRMDLLVTDFAVGALIDEVIRTLRPAMDRSRNRLAVELDPGLGVIRADALRVRQVLLNLMSNAAKFTTDGTVTLTARRDRESVSFELRDTGIGMDEEQLARVFRPFIQADDSTSRRYGGTGLGLVLARRFAEMMGGSVGIDSQLGVGTRVTFVIPVHSAPTRRTPRDLVLAA